MPTYRYALEVGEKERLEIIVTGIWREATILLDGNQIGVIPNPEALQKGQDFSLPDGSTLRVRRVAEFAMPSHSQVLQDGRPLFSSEYTPTTRLKAAHRMVYYVAGFNLVIGLMALLFESDPQERISRGWISIIFGLIFSILGFFTQRKSVIALILAIIIFAADGIGGVFLSVSQGYALDIFDLVIRIFLLIGMIQGVKAIRDLKQKEE